MTYSRRSGARRLTRIGFWGITASLVVACEGENVFQPGPGRGPDSRAPSVEIVQPREPAASPIGDSILIGALVKDDKGVDSVAFSGFSLRGDPDLGTQEVVERFERKVVGLPGAIDTTVTRFLVATADTIREDAFIVVDAYDQARNFSSDTLALVLGGPRVQLFNVQQNQQIQSGLSFAVRIEAYDPEGIIQVILRASGAFEDEIVKSFSPPVDSVVVDTSLVIPATAEGPLELTAIARSTLDVTGQDGPVRVVVTSGLAGDTTRPVARVVTSAPPRMELGDSVRVQVIGRDDAQGSGIARIGYTALAISPTRGDTLVATEERTFTPPRTGIVSEEFAFNPFNVDSLSLPDTLVFQVTGYLIDGDQNCSAALPTDSLAAVPCVSLPTGETVADGGLGDRVTRPVVAGRTVRLAGGGRIMDAAVDTLRRNLLLTNFERDQIETFRLQEERFLAPTPVGSEPWGMSLNRAGDSIMVANSGGTNISNVYLGSSLGTDALVEDPGRRFLTPDVVFFDVERSLDETGGIRFKTFVIPDATPPSFSDRPQFVAQDSVGRILYSTKTTEIGDLGTIRKAWVPTGMTDPEVVMFFSQAPLLDAPDFVAIANIDDVGTQLGSADSLGVQDDDVVLIDHTPGDRSATLTGGPGTIEQAVADLASQGSDVVAGTGRWNVPAMTFGDTTFVAASGDGGWVVFGEGAVDPVGRVIMYEAAADEITGVVAVTDLMTNASEIVRGIGLNHDGTLGVARGEGAYFFSTDLRLQGVSNLTPGGSGAALHPLHADYPSLENGDGIYDPDTHLAFLGTGDATIEIVDAFHFNRLGRLFVRNVVTGPLRASLPFPEDNVGLTCTTRAVFNGSGEYIGEAMDIYADVNGLVPHPAVGGPTEDLCVVIKLYGITDEGVTVVDVRKGDILRDHPSRLP